MDLLPTTNADGRDIVPMSEAQKYLFDLKGFVLLPALLSEEELVAIRAHQMKFLYERESMPPDERDNHGGPSQILLDHPAVVGVLNEVLSHQALASEECYGFRYDHTYTSHRQVGHDNFGPHGRRRVFQLSRQLAHLPDAVGQGAFRPDAGGVGAQRSRRRRWGHAFSAGQPQGRLPPARRAERARQCAVGELYLSGWFGGDFSLRPCAIRARAGPMSSATG